MWGTVLTVPSFAITFLLLLLTGKDIHYKIDTNKRSDKYVIN